MLINRRKLIKNLMSLIVAPAVVRVESIMPISVEKVIVDSYMPIDYWELILQATIRQRPVLMEMYKEARHYLLTYLNET